MLFPMSILKKISIYRRAFHKHPPRNFLYPNPDFSNPITSKKLITPLDSPRSKISKSRDSGIDLTGDSSNYSTTHTSTGPVTSIYKRSLSEAIDSDDNFDDTDVFDPSASD
ncbi:unnamed protein product, partial [Didymodactylos carnosus]